MNRRSIENAPPTEQELHGFKLGIRKYKFSEHKRVKMRDIAAGMGIPERRVRKIAEHLRNTGYPVGSDNKGYFLADTRGGLIVTINIVRAKRLALQKVESALNKILEERYGEKPPQTEIEI